MRPSILLTFLLHIAEHTLICADSSFHSEQSDESDCFRIRFKLAISLNTNLPLKICITISTGRTCFICATCHRSHTVQIDRPLTNLSPSYSASQVISKCLNVQTVYPLACIHTSCFPQP